MLRKLIIILLLNNYIILLYNLYKPRPSYRLQYILAAFYKGVHLPFLFLFYIEPFDLKGRVIKGKLSGAVGVANYSRFTVKDTSFKSNGGDEYHF